MLWSTSVHLSSPKTTQWYPEGETLKIIVARPPNFAAIAAALPMADKPSVIFTLEIRSSVLAAARSLRGSWPTSAFIPCNKAPTRSLGGTRYLADVEFRFAQELEAHRAEWRAWLSLRRNRAERRGYMVIIGMRLAGPLYGKMVRFAEARDLILKEEKALEDV